MKLYVYADESGTFDKAHNDLFVYGGIVVPGTETKKNVERLYASVEDDIRSHSSVFDSSTELKACFLGMKERKRLFGVIEHSECFQFGVIVDQSRIYDGIYSSKGSKQRYQDWALKMGIRQCVCTMLKRGTVSESDIVRLDVLVDEHSSSTSGRYNLRESINEEFRCGTYSPVYGTFHKPVFSPSFPEIKVSYLDSSRVTLVRAADITANWIFCAARDCASYPPAMRHIESEDSVILYRHPKPL